ncbi:formyltetrahydrofolate deformylase 1, mitochondrial-like isoform X1 [Canna indica]|uniref:Formyltetrahydrofolate deformylase 1, mitochondrial-like isoform X1 n=1 Tax=Canna indica TaxID=4628 RepID=A0AAQ3KGB1_9LILI|nr:formyltetrahydrofolate deformylase 1, mitochondrial-like isoform X1 [Canna indica]
MRESSGKTRNKNEGERTLVSSNNQGLKDQGSKQVHNDQLANGKHWSTPSTSSYRWPQVEEWTGASIERAPKHSENREDGSSQAMSRYQGAREQGVGSSQVESNNLASTRDPPEISFNEQRGRFVGNNIQVRISEIPPSHKFIIIIRSNQFGIGAAGKSSMRFWDRIARRTISSIAGGPAGSALGIHVFYCPDATGIVAKVSECIASRGGNIHSVDVFVPENKQIFYSRSEFVFDSTRWPRDVVDKDFLKLSKMFNAEKSVVRVPDLDPKYKIAVLASKQEHCLVDLLYRWQEGKLPVDISCVISNHQRAPDTHVIHCLERHGIPYHYLPTNTGNKRETEILELIEDTDFLVLARYMQVLSRTFLESYGKDVINIHHGLLPSFKGGNPSKQAFDAGVKLIGATSHFVTEELDSGPIIEQMVERVSHKDNLRSFVQKSENLEKQCLAQAIKSYCELRVLPYQDNKTVVF